APDGLVRRSRLHLFRPDPGTGPDDAAVDPAARHRRGADRPPLQQRAAELLP
nr:hypothetical protein [Tanacetum cinerariifolium]